MMMLTLLSCHQKETTSTNTNPQEITNKTISKNTSLTDINGKWVITKVSGGPMEVFPNGKQSPGMKVDLNPIWVGGSYEFIGGVAFLNIPNVTKEEVGNYTIDNKTIIFENTNEEKQTATIDLNNDLMTLSFDPDMYREVLLKNSQGAMEVDIASPVVFHLKKE